MKTTQFTKAEVNHLLGLLEINEREGFYFGNKDQYFNRHNKIKAKLKIDFISSSTLLKEKHKKDFEDWRIDEGYSKHYDTGLYKKEGMYFTRKEVLLIYDCDNLNL